MITDEMIVASAKELSLVMSAAYPDPAKVAHRFSLRFKRKMKRLVSKTDHPIRYLWVQRVASFILVLFIGFMLVFTISPTVRASVIGWIKAQYGAYIEYFFDEHLPDTAQSKQEYDILYLPTGFVMSQRIALDGFSLVVYSNADGNTISFFYSKDPDAGNIMVKEEGATINEVYVHNYNADVYVPDDPNDATGIIWYDTHNNMMFYISATCSMEEIIEMAESIS